MLIRMGASMLQPSDKRKAFFAVTKSGKREICGGRKTSFTALTILDNIKGKHISCHFTVRLHIAHCILLTHICRGRYMLKRKKKIIIRNYEQLCALTSGGLVLNCYIFLKLSKLYTDRFHSAM